MNKPTYINIRIRVTRPDGMSVAEARRKLQRLLITGMVPEGIEVAYVDWRNGRGAYAKTYTYVDDEALDALVQARGVLLSDRTRLRFSIVEGEGEGDADA